MKLYNIEFNVKNKPELDPDFMPLLLFKRAYERGATKPVTIALERDDQCHVINTHIYGTPEMHDADMYYIDRIAKILLWVKGGYRFIISGDRDVYEHIKNAYTWEGSRAFDVDFMDSVYLRPIETEYRATPPAAYGKAFKVGRHLDGCRIGFDAGGSDRKVSAVIDGEAVYSEEVVWSPKTHDDISYHYEGIISAFRSAAAHMPRVDAIGVSSAGVIINNLGMKVSLFTAIPKSRYDDNVRNVYLRAAKEFGDVPVAVYNDGDVTALAGAMSLEVNNVLGIAMGTSEAGGFVDADGCITGWLNELAFVPVDVNPGAMRDEWSGDIGCGATYFSQDGVIKLAGYGGIKFAEGLTPAEKLKVVQKLLADGDETAKAVYRSMGVYLGHSLAFYYDLYRCESILLLGRVMSGEGGDMMVAEAKRVLADEYPDIAKVIKPIVPDEKARRVGQSVAAASLPAITK